MRPRRPQAGHALPAECALASVWLRRPVDGGEFQAESMGVAGGQLREAGTPRPQRVTEPSRLGWCSGPPRLPSPLSHRESVHPWRLDLLRVWWWGGRCRRFCDHGSWCRLVHDRPEGVLTCR